MATTGQQPDWSVLRLPPLHLSAWPFTTISMATTLGPWTSTWWWGLPWMSATPRCGRRVSIWATVGFLAWPLFRRQVHTRWVSFPAGLNALKAAAWYWRQTCLDSYALPIRQWLWGDTPNKRGGGGGGVLRMSWAKITLYFVIIPNQHRGADWEIHQPFGCSCGCKLWWRICLWLARWDLKESPAAYRDVLCLVTVQDYSRGAVMCCA